MKASTKDWLEYARRDLKAAELLINDSYLANICLYHCQQTVEKSFKAVLEEFSLHIPKIHSVTTLYEQLPVKTKNSIYVKADELNDIDDIYIDARYPTDLGLLPNGFPSIEKAKEIFDISNRIFNDVKAYLEKSPG
ncbi:HEPN domain protein [bacterium BMS3Abin03]|nr:HEPN domain protein [bacterium BMS3Abin03]